MSETTNLKLKKHDNPSTNEEQFDVENYLNGNWDKIDENVGEVNTNISNINSKNTELEKELKEMQEDFYQNSIRGQASGEYIHVEDSSNCRARIGIGGNSEQETREGYNLLSASEQYTYTSGNVKLASDGAGKYTMNGDGTAQTETIKYSFELEKEYTIKNNDYLHIMNNGTVTSNAIIILLDSNKSGVVSYDFTTNNKIENLSNYAGKTIKYIQLYMNPIKVDITLTPMIINNVSTAKSFEAYGAMPSPDYPSPVKTVGSNVNIFDLESYYNIVPSANCTKQLLKNGIRLNFTAGNDAYIGGVYNIGTTMAENQKAACIKVKPNTTYTLKMSSAPNCYMSFLDKDYKAVKAFVNISSNEYVFSTDSSTEYIYLRLGYQNRTSGLTSYDFTDIKCVEGTEVGEYSKHGQGCVKVTKCNKNLANIEKFNIAGGTGTTYPKTIQGLKENTEYIISFYKSRIAGATISNTAIHGCRQMHFYHNEEKLSEYIYNSPVSGFSSGNKKFEIKITTPAKCNKVICYFDNANGDNNINITVYDIQLEEGTTTSYEEHQEQTYIMPTQQPMRSISDIRDTFVKKDDKWYERHYVERLIFDGTEGWNYDKNNNRFYFAKAGNKGSGYIMSSHYKKGDTTKQNYTCEIWSSAILFRDERFTELEDFKNMIKTKYDEGTPIYTDIVLQEPQDIECTEEQSRILDELNNARTYKNVTNIYSTDEISPILSLDYAKDLETLLNNTQALAVNNASEGV